MKSQATFSYHKSRTIMSMLKGCQLHPGSRGSSPANRKSKPSKESKQNPRQKHNRNRLKHKTVGKVGLKKGNKVNDNTNLSEDVSRRRNQPRSWPTSILEMSKAEEKPKRSAKKMRKKPKKRSKGHTASIPLEEDEGRVDSQIGKKSKQFKEIIQKITVSSSKFKHRDIQKYSTGNPSSGKVITPNHSVQLHKPDKVLPFSFEDPPCKELQCQQQLLIDHELSLGLQLKPHYSQIAKHQKSQSFTLVQKKQVSQSSLKEDSLVIDWDYLSRSGEVTAQTRIMLVNALLEYSAFARHQRQSFYLALQYMDLFASLQHKLTPSLYKTIGVTGLVLSIKKEQSCDSLGKLAAVSNIPMESIRRTQLAMLRAFKFELTSKTLNRYLNSMTARWDSFVQSEAFKETHLAQNRCCQGQNLKFREHTGECYLRMCELYQLADASVHRIQFLRFGRKKLAASLLYLMLRHAIQFREDPLSAMMDKFERASLFYLDTLGFNQVFSQFLSQYSKIELGEMVGCIQAVSRLLRLKVLAELPSLGWQCQSYQELLSLSLYNPELKKYILQQFYH